MTEKSKSAEIFLSRTVDRINSIPSYFMILFILLFYFIRLGPNDNEEGLMQVSRHLYNPEWLPQCFDSITNQGPRFLYQYTIGFLLDHFSFETVVVGGLVMLCILLAYPLYKIYRLLEIGNTGIILHLPLLYFPHQSFFSGEYIFLNLESKTFAYIFVLLGVYYLLKERPLYTTFSGIAATYLHLAVGGWFMLYILLYQLISSRSLKKVFQQGLIYTAGILPLFMLLRAMVIDNISVAETPVGLNWIFTHFRQPHHTALFSSIPYFISKHAEGVLLSFAMFVICLFVFRQFGNKYNRTLNRLNMLMFTGMAVCLVFAFFDHSGSFVKYFPFRMNALFTFLVFLQMTCIVSHYVVDKKYIRFFRFSVLTLFFIVFVPRQGYFLVKQAQAMAGHTPATPFNEMCEYIRTQTPLQAVVLLIPEKSTFPKSKNIDSGWMLAHFDMDASFIRKAERRRFVSFKFGSIAPGSTKLYDWYLKVQAKMEVLQNLQKVCEAGEKFGIDYILSDFRLEEGACYELIHQNDRYYLYRLNTLTILN